MAREPVACEPAPSAVVPAWLANAVCPRAVALAADAWLPCPTLVEFTADAVAPLPKAEEPDGVAEEPSPTAVLPFAAEAPEPMAMEPVATALVPMAIALTPVACALTPWAMAPAAVACDLLPMAIAPVAVACAPLLPASPPPMATEYCPVAFAAAKVELPRYHRSPLRRRLGPMSRIHRPRSTHRLPCSGHQSLSRNLPKPMTTRQSQSHRHPSQEQNYPLRSRPALHSRRRPLQSHRYLLPGRMHPSPSPRYPTRLRSRQSP